VPTIVGASLYRELTGTGLMPGSLHSMGPSMVVIWMPGLLRCLTMEKKVVVFSDFVGQ